MDPLRGRRILVAVAVVAVSPYVLLKLAWLAGLDWGVRDAGLMSSPVYRIANLVTLLLDLVLVAVVVVLSGPRTTGRWGRLLAVPATVGLGLLLPVVVAAPLIALVDVLRPADTALDTGLAGWVYAVVYSGFTVQFGCLAAATALHVGRRAAPGDRPRPRTILVGATALVTVHVVGLLTWAAGAAVGWDTGQVLTRNSRLLYAVLAAIAVLGVTLAWRPGRPVRAFGVLVLLTGTWTWAAFSLLTAVAGPEGTRVGAAGVVLWCTGILGGLVATGVVAPATPLAGRADRSGARISGRSARGASLP